MSKYADEYSGRPDTTITNVEVTGVEGWTFKQAAAKFVTDQHPNAEVLGVWRLGERGKHGYPGWAVEWVES